jgi:putative endonuclease
MKTHWVYLLTNKDRGTFYVGMTNDLVRRVYEHRIKAVKGFTRDHDLTRLIWFEEHGDREQALRREGLIKKWKREWKYNLVEHQNPFWEDLYDGICV